MIHKKQHPEYKYRPKKRKHLKRPTERLPHEIETLAKRALLNPDHDFTANTRALISQQNACMSPDSTLPGADSTTSRTPCQYRYRGPVSSFPNNHIVSESTTTLSSCNEPPRVYLASEVYSPPQSVLASYMRPNDPMYRAEPHPSTSSCLFPRVPVSYMSYSCRGPYENPPLVKVEHKSFYPGGPVQQSAVRSPSYKPATPPAPPPCSSMSTLTTTTSPARAPETRTEPPRAQSEPRDTSHDQSKLVIDALSSLNDIKDIDVNEFDMYLPKDGQESTCSSTNAKTWNIL